MRSASFHRFDTRRGGGRLHRLLLDRRQRLQPGAAAARINAGMHDDIRELLQRRRYDEALERLFDLYGRKVYRMAVAMLRDTGRAEEVTQDTFVKVWRAFPEYDGRAAPSTWLYTIARNTCLTALRREAYRRTTPIDEAPEPQAPIAQSSGIDWDRCLARLPEVQRTIVTLFYFEDRSIKDVAELMDLAEGTIKSHLHRARRALGAMLE
jgi:RNA polymerase sigma-70 factor, ECF subfamily